LSTIPTGFIAHFRYSHMVLSDYMNAKFPDATLIDPADQHRQLWASDPNGYLAGLYTPSLFTGDPITNGQWRTLFGASYNTPPAHWDTAGAGSRVFARSSGSVFIPGSAKSAYGGKKLSDVSYPSQKVMMYDNFGRHFGKSNDANQWMSVPQSRQPLCFYDGSVVAYTAGQCNMGIDPNTGADYGSGYSQYYEPSVIEPPLPFLGFSGPNYWLYTANGLRGNDIGGKEQRFIPTQY